MNLLRVSISSGWLGLAGAALIAAGCSNENTGTGQSAGPTTTPAAGATTTPAPATGASGGGSTTTGTAGKPGTSTTTPASPGTGGTPSATATAGSGGAKASTSNEFPTSGGTGGSTTAAGSGGATAAAGTSGSAGGGAPPAGGGCDKSTFIQECPGGGDQWGMMSMKGPCAKGETIYGVKQDFGPYGVRSKYNVGQMFNTGNTAAGDFAICSVFIDSFGADPKGSADLKNYHDLDFGLYSVFYPGCMPEGEKFPLITWGNGTCAMPEGYGPLLRWVASFGYIVVAANSVQTGDGSQMRKALDFMLAENKDSKSEFFGKIDEEKIGAMGHSQGGMGTVAAASDQRIKSVILWNGGTAASKTFLSVSGDKDISGSPGSLKNAADASQQQAAWLFYHQIPAAVDGSTTGTTAPGHLTLMMEPERVQTVAVKWWDLTLKKDPEAKKYFVGSDCSICKGTELPSMWVMGASGPSHEYGANSKLQ